MAPTLKSDDAEVYDVFISYAHKDNEVALGEKPSSGFVSSLVSRIRLYGEMRYGTTLKLFFDTDLASGVFWERSTYQALDSCRIFVPIVSPSWLNSTRAATEWSTVFKRIENENLTGNRTRIIPVSFELEKLLEEPEEGSGTKEEKALQRRPYMVQELQLKHQLKHRFRDSMAEEDFKAAAWAVVDDIFDLLDRLKDAPGKSVMDAKKSTVFLGFAISEPMKKWKENVRSELKAHDFDVREVELDISKTAQQLSDAIQENVRACAAAVHFLGESPGISLPGDRNRGIVQIQCDAVEQVKSPKLLEFFWTGPDLKIDDVQEESYKKFLQDVRRSDVHMTESVMAFEKLLLARLKAPSRSRGSSPAPRKWESGAGSDIFISYTNEDRPKVRPLVDALQKQGWSVWWDRTILPGRNWERVLEAAIRDARCVIVLWSRTSIDSDWVRSEAHEGMEREILVPALLDSVRIPLAFRRIQAANLIGWSGELPSDQFEELASAVSEVLSSAASPGSSAFRPGT